MNGKGAMMKVFEMLDRGVRGVVIIREGDGYDVIPQAYLSDISYTEDPEIVTTYHDGTELGDWFDLSDQSEWDSVAEWAGAELRKFR